MADLVSGHRCNEDAMNASPCFVSVDVAGDTE